jgi:hypothetical protein
MMEWIGDQPEFQYEVTTKLYRKVGVAAATDANVLWIELENTVKDSNKPHIRAKLNVAEADELITALMYARKLAAGEPYEIP